MIHAHGGNPETLINRLGLSHQEVIDFSVNISPYGVPEPIRELWPSLLGDLLSYPTTNGQKVKELYAKQFDISTECILPGNGSIECLYLLPKILKLENIGIIAPSFYDYERAFRIAGSRIRYFYLSEKEDFSLPSLKEIHTFLNSVDGLILGSPNNPTGTLFPKKWILDLAERYPDKWFIVDEAFIQFLEDFKNKTLVNRQTLRPNVCVLQSLTKFYALPGIRLGALVAAKPVITALEKIKEPWSINRIAEKIVRVIPCCEDYGKELRKKNTREKLRLENYFSTFRNIKLFPNNANFFLARWLGTENLDDLIRYLLNRGIFVRDCRNFSGLGDHFFRFAVKSATENDKLIEVFNKLNAEGGCFEQAV